MASVNQTFEECLQENFGKTTVDCTRCYNIDERPPWQLFVHAMVIGIIIAVSLVGNVLILVLVLKYKKLRQFTTVISLNIIAANTFLIFSYHLPTLVSSFSAKWVFQFAGCQVFGFFSVSFIILRFLTMGVLAFDRFCIVRFPFSYPKYEKCIITVMLSVCWVFPLILSVSTLKNYASVAFRHNIPTCLFYTPTIGRGLLPFSIVNTITFMIGGILPTVVYVYLFQRARKMRHSIGAVGTIMIGNSEENIVNTRKFSNDLRPVVTFALIFITFTLTGLPTFLLQLLRSFSTGLWCSVPPLVHFAAISFFLSSTALDPVLIMRDRDFRKRLKHLICCHNNCGRYYNDRSNIYPEIPRERDFDAVRKMALRALALVAPQSSGSSNTSLSSTDSVARPYRPRSGSAPSKFFTGRRPSTVAVIPDTIEEVEAEENVATRKSKAQSREVEVEIHPYYQSETTRTRGNSANVEEVETHEEFEPVIVSSDDNRECVEVTINFD